MELLGKHVLGGLTVLHLVAIIVAGLVAIRLLRWVFGHRPRGSSYMIDATCPACGWRGQVSKYARQCPACNTRF